MAKLEQVAVLSGHTDRVWNVAWHPTLQLLATCGGDRSIRFWAPKPRAADDTRAPQWICIDVLDDFTTRTVRSVAWSPSGEFIAAGSFDAKANVWRVSFSGSDLTAPGAMSIQPIATLDGHENEVKCVSWARSGSLLATSSRDKSVWIWELVEQGQEVDMVSVLTGHEQDVKAVAWHPVNDILVSASYDDALKVWGQGLEDWECITTLAGAHTSTVWECAWEPAKGTRLASVSEDGSLSLWQTEAPPKGCSVGAAVGLKKVGSVKEAHARTVYSCSWAEDPAACTPASTGVTDGGELDLPVGAAGPAPCRLATGGADDAIRVWKDKEEDERKAEEAGEGGAASSGSAAPLQQVAVASKAHAGDVNCVRWQSPRLSARWAGQGSLILASAGDDCLVKLWRYTEQ